MIEILEGLTITQRGAALVGVCLIAWSIGTLWARIFPRDDEDEEGEGESDRWW